MENRKGYLYINEVRITGRLTDEVNYKEFENGGSVAEFVIANNRRWKAKDREDWNEDTSFFKVKSFNGLAEKCKSKLKKGDFVYVEGRLQEETWGDENQRKRAVKIIADSVHLVYPNKKSDEKTKSKREEK